MFPRYLHMLYMSSIKINSLLCSESLIHHRLIWEIIVPALAKNEGRVLAISGKSLKE